MTQESGVPRGALQGIKVVDLSRYGTGPVCAQILGDMGADVIKVEPPTGDPQRFSPPTRGDLGASFMAFNRNKRSITLDIRTAGGKEVLLRLVQWGDVLVENFRPGTMDRLGLDYERLKEANPRIIMVSVSGFGSVGPDAQRAAFDYIGQAMGGIMSVTGTRDGPPMLCGANVADFAGAFFAAIGALAALYVRQETGTGQHVETSLYEAVLALMSNKVAYEALGGSSERGGFVSAPTGTFRTADNVYVFVAGHDDSHFPYVARLLGRQEMAADARYSSRAARRQQQDELNRLMAEWVGTRTLEEVTHALGAGGVPFGRVQTVPDLLTDPQLRALGAIVEIDHGEERPAALVGPHPRLRGTPSSVRLPAPHLGQHNDEVYRGLLGYSAEAIAQMRAAKVI